MEENKISSKQRWEVEKENEREEEEEIKVQQHSLEVLNDVKVIKNMCNTSEPLRKYLKLSTTTQTLSR